MGVARHVVVADSDAGALSIARRARASIRLLHVLQPFVEVVPELAAYQGSMEVEFRQERVTAIDPSVVGADGVYRHTGPALVFTSERAAIAAIK